ncbi:MAG TPA: protein-glutamate O-methyltransferase CheR [Gemmatimonadales bacterium]|jgi:two-component system CheB/CheR fusion protein|nr:protein-glutamate O-methyltransferase CheR [Gemmatimonadales bacterium]
MSGTADFGLSEVIRQLSGRGAGGFEWYKESCLVRRIEVRMRARGIGTLSGYASLLADDAAELDRLLRSLSVRVTGFFRNPDTWLRLAELLGTEGLGSVGRLTAWSMGCSTGEEAWSLAMLLLAHSRRSGGVPAPEAIKVFGSDVDAHALTVAERGSYPAKAALPAIREVLPEPEGSQADGHFEVSAALRPLVKFRREDLTAPTPQAGWHDLVCCRNVLIFLGREGQRRVLETACRALRPGGLLVLGRTESLVAVPRAELQAVDVTHRIYRKAA